MSEAAPQYRVATKGRHFIVAPDAESIDALFFLIEQRLGFPRVAAEATLAKGMMIISQDLIVTRQDVFDAVMRECKETLFGASEKP